MAVVSPSPSFVQRRKGWKKRAGIERTYNCWEIENSVGSGPINPATPCENVGRSARLGTENDGPFDFCVDPRDTHFPLGLTRRISLHVSGRLSFYSFLLTIVRKFFLFFPFEKNFYTIYTFWISRIEFFFIWRIDFRNNKIINRKIGI